jgi:tetratricopeptide (TPR) repeat protein
MPNENRLRRWAVGLWLSLDRVGHAQAALERLEKKLKPPAAADGARAKDERAKDERAKDERTKDARPIDRPAPGRPPLPEKEPRAEPPAGQAQPPAGQAQPPAPPAAAANPPAGNGGNLAAIQQARQNAARRLELLKELHDQRLVLLARREALTVRTDPIRTQLVEATAEYARLSKLALSVQGQLATVSQGIDTLRSRLPFASDRFVRQDLELRLSNLSFTGQQLQLQYDALDADATRVNIVGQGLLSQLTEADQEMAALYAEADQLRVAWLALVDPFGSLDQGDHAAALATLSEWTRLDGQNAGAFLARGFAYVRLGQPDKALDDFTAACDIAGPTLPWSLAARGWLLHGAGQRKEGLADLANSLKLDKASPFAYLCRARARCAEGDFGRAVKDFETALRLNPQDHEAARMLSLVRSTCPKPSYRNGTKAIKAATTACELTGWRDWQALDALAAAHAQDGDFDKAVETGKQARDLAAGDNRAACEERLKLYAAGQPLRIEDWGL